MTNPQYVFAPEVLDFLVTLGWNIKVLHNAGTDNQIECELHPPLRVSRATKGDARYFSKVFVLWAEASHNSVEPIPRKLINANRPGWQKTAMLWYTRAVFSLQQIAAAREADECQRRVEAENREQGLRVLLGGEVPKFFRSICSISQRQDTGVVLDVNGGYLWIDLPYGLTLQEKVRRLKKLALFLEQEDLVRP